MTFIPSVIGTVDPNNSTNTALLSQYTGGWTDVSAYNSICLYVNTDVGSALNGLVIQFSPNMVDTTETLTTTIYPSVPYTTIYQVRSKYYRIIYSSLTYPQTFFYLQSSLKLGSASITGSILSILNSSSATLAISGSFNGSFENITECSQILCSFVATGTGSGTCSFYTYFSSAGSSADVTNGPYLLHPNVPVQQIICPTRKYFRISITNNTSSSVTLSIETRYAQAPAIIQNAVGDIPTESDSAVTTKSVIVGQYSGTGFDHVNITKCTGNIAAVNTSIQDPVGVFGDVSIINKTPISQLAFIYNYLNLQTTKTMVSGNGKTTCANRLCLAQTTSTTGSFALIQAKKTLVYRGGQGNSAILTAIFTPGVAGTTQLAGVGNFTIIGTVVDGYFFGYNGTSFGILFASSSSGSLINTWIPQASWNIDNLSGNDSSANPSGSTLNPLNGNIYQIKYQYLGFGTIRFSIEDPKNGTIIPVHVINYTNTSILTNISNPNLSIGWYASNGSTTSNIITYGASAGTFLEGERAYTGPRYCFNNTKSAVTTITNIFSLQCSNTFQGLKNYSDVKISNVSVAMASGGNVTGILQIILNATVGGTPSFQPLDAGSVITTDITGTTVTGGTILHNYANANSNSYFVDVSDYNITIQPGDILTFAVTASASVSAIVAVSWVEDT